MADLNNVSLIGRLTSDAVFKTLSTGTALCEFSIANNRGWGDKAKVHFIDVKMFGKGAEAINKYLVKGKRVGISGELTIETWDDKNTGAKRSKAVVVTFDVQLLDGGTEKPAESFNHTPATTMQSGGAMSHWAADFERQNPGTTY